MATVSERGGRPGASRCCWRCQWFSSFRHNSFSSFSSWSSVRTFAPGRGIAATRKVIFRRQEANIPMPLPTVSIWAAGVTRGRRKWLIRKSFCRGLSSSACAWRPRIRPGSLSRGRAYKVSFSAFRRTSSRFKRRWERQRRKGLKVESSWRSPPWLTFLKMSSSMRAWYFSG